MPNTQVEKPKKQTDYISAIGRRKTATARVRLFRKSGDMIVNGVPVGKYFNSEIQRVTYMKPFDITGSVGKFSFTALVEGSGKMGQLDAVVHGLARALAKVDQDAYKITLKKAGLLTRDSRLKESRKVGTGGKARRKKSSPKR